MNDNLEETVHNIKTLGLINLESYVFTHNRFNTYVGLYFSDLSKTQIYKMPYRESPHHEIEILMNFNYLNVFKQNDENFLFEIEDKKYIYVGKEVFTSEKNGTIVKYSSELGLNDVEYPSFYGEENIYFMLHQKYVPIQEYGTSTLKKRVWVFI